MIREYFSRQSALHGMDAHGAHLNGVWVCYRAFRALLAYASFNSGRLCSERRILLGWPVVHSLWSHRSLNFCPSIPSILKTLKPVEIPEGYWVKVGVYTNLLVAGFGVVIISYFVFRLD